MGDILKEVFSLRERAKRLLFVLLVAFMASFFVIRLFSIHWGRSIYYHGFQIHHFYFGMLFLSIGGIVALLNQAVKPRYYAGALIGIGIGLFADEVGLLLNCTSPYRQCLYAFPDVYDIFVWIGGAILLLIVSTSIFELWWNRL